MSSENRKCPFCGTAFLLFHDEGRGTDEWRCMGCGNREGSGGKT